MILCGTLTLAQQLDVKHGSPELEALKKNHAFKYMNIADYLARNQIDVEQMHNQLLVHWTENNLDPGEEADKVLADLNTLGYSDLINKLK